MNLGNLNEKLHQLFDDVKAGKIDHDKARTLNSTAANIVKNAKAQLDAVKMYDQMGMVPANILPQINKSLDTDTSGPSMVPRALLTKKQDEFAKTLGYNSRLEALTKMTDAQFTELFENQNNDNS